MQDKRNQNNRAVHGKAPAARSVAVGVSVLDTVFLDEPAAAARTRSGPKEPSSWELFADEDASGGHAGGAARELDVNAMALPVSGRTMPVAAPQLSPTRPSLLATFSILAALAAFATVRACQTGGVTPVAVWHFLGF